MRQPGRPPLGLSQTQLREQKRQRNKEFGREAAAAGLVRVSVMVPASQAPAIREIAAGMRRVAKRRRADAGLDQPRAPIRTLGTVERELAVQQYREGGTLRDIRDLVGPALLDDAIAAIVRAGEAGSTGEAMRELQQREAAELRIAGADSINRR